jgi:hypothetical protein
MSQYLTFTKSVFDYIFKHHEGFTPKCFYGQALNNRIGCQPKKSLAERVHEMAKSYSDRERTNEQTNGRTDEFMSSLFSPAVDHWPAQWRSPLSSAAAQFGGLWHQPSPVSWSGQLDWISDQLLHQIRYHPLQSTHQL